MALIPPSFLDCVVALGIDDAQGKRRWVASGFLYGHFLSRVDETTGRYRVYLVTNRHVLEGQSMVYLRFNPRDAMPAREYTLDFERKQDPVVCYLHPDPDIDLGVVRINPHVLDRDGIQYDYFLSDQHVVGRESLDDIGITEGDFAYVLGFPLGLVGEQRSFVIARSATIARIRDYLAGNSKEILMDCLTFPGNSGGPVFGKPELVSIRGTKRVNVAYLLGIVSASIPYQDVAVSRQTGRPRVIFEDNTGLTSIVPAQYLVDLIVSLHPDAEAEKDEATHDQAAKR